MKAKHFLSPALSKIVGGLSLAFFLSAVILQADDSTEAAKIWAESLRLEQNSDYASALEKMSDFARVSPDTYLYQVRCGWLEYMSKNYDQAAESYLAASKIEPAALTPFLGLIYTYEASAQRPKAIEACHEALQRDPVNYTATKMLAAISYENGDFLEAARNYQNLLRVHPEDETLLSGTGWSLLKLNKMPEAAACFQRLLVLSPTYPYATVGYRTAQGKTTE